MSTNFVEVRNGQALKLADISNSSWDEIERFLVDATKAGQRVSAMFGLSGVGQTVEVIFAVSADASATIKVGRSVIAGRSFRSLTPQCPQLHLFERELAEQFGLSAEGHPWFKPVRFSPPLKSDDPSRVSPTIGDTDYFRVHGEEVHQVAVGPVHAGVIEPGHFRFQCHGENVFHLEISLGYQHRGIEAGLIGGPNRTALAQIETIAGDTSIGHSWAYALCLEGLAGVQVPAQAEAIRAVALELERLANHTGDMGALAGDVGYLPTMSYCGRIRGDFLNMTGLICGNRFGRGTVKPGGVRFGIDSARAAELLARLTRAERDVTGAIELLWETPSVMARFEGTGIVQRELAIDIGLVGVAARACGLERDTRFTHPFGFYNFNLVPIALGHQGDVASRALVRWLEIRRSIQIVREQLERINQLELGVEVPVGKLEPNSLVVSLVEGWRGEICHVAVTDFEGKFRRYKICDPSFHNWTGLALALRGQQISDFPLCNKSFNLSYCGYDL